MPNHSEPSPQPQTEIPEEDKLLAVLAYVPVLCLIPFVRTDRSPFVTGHIRLGILLFVAEVFALILRYLPAVWDVVIFICVIIALVGIVHVVRGQTFSLPFVSEWFGREREPLK
ncbi:hypothetical protein KKH27_06695 [bacterium]|nr:hypothetical protein [bacterium]MBU1983797.1 hypothetical protein [bacterium]